MLEVKPELFDLNQLKKISSNLIAELTQASTGSKNSFAYARNEIPAGGLVKEGEIFQVIVMGGSHLESSLVQNINSHIEILSKYKEGLPHLESKKLVCELFAKQLHSEVTKVSLNFAYPMQPIVRQGFIDGILISTTKEHRFVGMLHNTVGLMLEEYIFETQKRKIQVSVCNDTVGLGIAGTKYSDKYKKEEIICGIVGTGYNFGFFESENIFINVESGNFDKFEQTYTGKIIDALSTNPGKQYLEKEVGGAYLSKHFNILAKLNSLPINLHTTKELSHSTESENQDEAELASTIFERATSLVAMQIFGIYEFKKQSLGDFKMLCLIEGSLFWKGYQFKEKTYSYLEKLGLSKDKCEIAQITNSGIIGAGSLLI